MCCVHKVYASHIFREIFPVGARKDGLFYEFYPELLAARNTSKISNKKTMQHDGLEQLQVHIGSFRYGERQKSFEDICTGLNAMLNDEKVDELLKKVIRDFFASSLPQRIRTALEEVAVINAQEKERKDKENEAAEKAFRERSAIERKEREARLAEEKLKKAEAKRTWEQKNAEHALKTYEMMTRHRREAEEAKVNVYDFDMYYLGEKVNANDQRKKLMSDSLYEHIDGGKDIATIVAQYVTW